MSLRVEAQREMVGLAFSRQGDIRAGQGGARHLRPGQGLSSETFCVATNQGLNMAFCHLTSGSGPSRRGASEMGREQRGFRSWKRPQILDSLTGREEPMEKTTSVCRAKHMLKVLAHR
ncbi:hypothetical protein E2P81_ATG09783 [Venturia nashicola]|nr:hypothetical protein E2P81_ATG09783 [Venturia nashicola]